MAAIPNRLRHTGTEMPLVPDLSLISPGDTAMAACLRIDAGLFVCRWRSQARRFRCR